MAPGGFVKKFLSLSSLATLAIVLGMVSWASAQTSPSTSAPDAAPSQQTPSQQPSTQQPPAPEMPPSQQQTPSSETPSSQTPSQTPPSQSPDATAPESGSKAGSQSSGSATDANGAQTFSGTVVKQGDKYVLKDDTGKTYDIDHQTDVARFEGKRVRVQGTLDPNGKILVK
jgi:hypothetical protein